MRIFHSFKRLTSKDVKQIELKMFFTWEFLTNENIDKNIWHLAKKTGSGENFNKENFVKFAETAFYTEKVPVEVTNNYKESHLKFIYLIKKLIYRNNTLTLCNKVCPNASEN